jgi:peptide/nickel transport system substrate-binding protein
VVHELWAMPIVERVAKRVGWTVPPEMTALVRQAVQEEDVAAAAKLWIEWQRQVVDEANELVLFQPTYQIAVRKTVKDFPLTGAGWWLEVGKVTLA